MYADSITIFSNMHHDNMQKRKWWLRVLKGNYSYEIAILSDTAFEIYCTVADTTSLRFTRSCNLAPKWAGLSLFFSN
jgi:hypothetical protein